MMQSTPSERGGGTMYENKPEDQTVTGSDHLPDDLIARLEAATEGSRKLSDAVLLETGWTKDQITVGNVRYVHYKDRPDYTTSLDAALPWERIVEVKFHESPDGDAQWTALHVPVGQPFAGSNIVVSRGYGQTEALARRIAALKARKHD